MGAETSLAMQGFGAGVQATGAYFGAKAQKTALDTQANVADINADLSIMSAQSAMLAGQKQEQASRLETAKVKSAQKVAFNANGIASDSDTVNRVLTTTDVVGEVNANTISANAARTAFGYQAQAVGFRNQAIGMRSTSGGISPFFAGASSIVGSAGRVASSWYKLNKEGAFDTPKVDTSYGPQNNFISKIFGQHNLVSDALY